MATNYYSLDGIQTELRKRLSEAETLLAAWEKVTFPTKKDGKPFKIMAKNIQGATYRSWEYAFNPANEKEIVVHAWDKHNGYVSDTVSAHVIAKYLTEPAMIAKKENLCPKESMLEQIYLYDLDDIKKAIAARINHLRERVSALKIELEKAPTIYREYLEKYNAIRQYLTEATAGNDQHDLFYAIVGTVEKSY